MVFGNLMNADTVKTIMTGKKKSHVRAKLVMKKKAAVLAIPAYVFFFQSKLI